MTNGFVLNALSDKETEDARSFNEENEKEILIMIEKDIQEFKNKHTMYWISQYSSLSSIDIQEF